MNLSGSFADKPNIFSRLLFLSFKETSDKDIELYSSENDNSCKIKRSPEIIYGLRNFIGNAIKFAKQNINISLKINKDLVNILIEDDGPGFPDDIIKILGEPYIKSKSQEISSKSGTGLGTFLGKTLLERQFANLTFSKDSELGGASVKISWNVNYLKFNV